ncbi:MAG: hypothetical protein Q4G25_11970 [Paracoccus sp. (in: a-proteobacteria)]|nr:hypothetical protein [Paracoccus sp. (in: a-proteobacteria)]
MSHADILAAGLVCPAGTSLDSSSAAFARGERFLRQQRDMIGPDGFPVSLAMVDELAGRHDSYNRILILLDWAMQECLEQLDRQGVGAPAPLTLLLNPMLRQPGAEAWFSGAIRDYYGDRFSEIAVRFGGSAAGLSLLAAAPGPLHFVACADSLVTPEMIDALIMDDRLNRSGNPWGVIPGEGAVVLALGQGDAPAGRLRAVAVSHETVMPADENRAALGRALGAAMRDALGDRAPARLLSDLDGGRDATEEFGLAVMAAGPPVAALADRVQALAPQIGQPGIAAGLILAGLACRGQGAALVCAADAPGALRASAFIEPGEVA